MAPPLQEGGSVFCGRQIIQNHKYQNHRFIGHGGRMIETKFLETSVLRIKIVNPACFNEALEFSFMFCRVGLVLPSVRSSGSFDVKVPSVITSLPRSLYSSGWLPEPGLHSSQQEAGWVDEGHSPHIWAFPRKYVCFFRSRVIDQS